MAQREVRVAWVGDTRSLQRAVRSADASMNTFAGRMQSIGGRMRSVGASMTRSLTLPLVGFGILAYRELSAGERALAQTQAVIESTGGAARQSVQDILDLSASLSELTSIDDEPIQDAANTLLTFRNIAGDTFEQATTATLDLATAMDRDLRGSAVLVGKALNDPIRGMSALTRVGVQFTDEQRDAVAAMVAFGDTAGAQQLILEELNAEFGGSAEALGGTVTGRLNRVKNQMEEMGASILEDLMPALEDLANILSGVAGAYSDLTPKQQKFAAGAVALAAVAGPLTSLLGGVATALGAIAVALGVSVGVVAAVIVSAIGLAIALAWVVRNWQMLSDVATQALSNIRANVPGASVAIAVLGANVRLVIGYWRTVIGVTSTAIGVFLKIGSITFGGLLAGLRGIAAMIERVVAAANALLGVLGRIGNAATSVSGSVTDNLAPPEAFIPSGGRNSGGSSGADAGGVAAESAANAIGRAVAEHLRKQPLMTVGVG